MNDSKLLRPFAVRLVAAFPYGCRPLACQAAEMLEPFVDAAYWKRSTTAVLGREHVHIPKRLHLIDFDITSLPPSQAASLVHCLCTRSNDGYLRQSALNQIIRINQPWSIPFVVLLAGEYVVEIIEDMVAGLPVLDHDAYIAFVRENRALMRCLRSKATSYWNAYYRSSYENRRQYPGLAFLSQLELWAA